MAKVYVTLYNVRDTRNDKEHSVAIVEEKKVRYFVPIDSEETQN